MNTLLILVGKFLAFISKITSKGSGSTWPGHIALSTKQTFIKDLLSSNPQLKIIFVVGTNGKTTTTSMIATILKRNGKRVIQNNSGANLLNGVASTFLLNGNIFGKIKADYAIVEIDENTLPLVLQEITPFAIVVLNLYRDQLDRYGELDTIARKWHDSFKKLPKNVHVLLNGDDPLIAFLGDQLTAKVTYFGLKKSDITTHHLQHAADSIYCPRCQSKLVYNGIFYSHNGLWHCPSCKFKHPITDSVDLKFPLPGLYNKYNTTAAVLVAKKVGIVPQGIEKAFDTFTPAFGRQEKITYKGKPVQIFLSKNPTSFNQSLETVIGLGAKHVLFVLNDKIPDGRDVSWIWDINIEDFLDKFKQIVVSGDRAYDMGLRINYSMQFPNKDAKLQIVENLKDAIEFGVESVSENETLFILATYSAMLDVRKIITGRSIL